MLSPGSFLGDGAAQLVVAIMVSLAGSGLATWGMSTTADNLRCKVSRVALSAMLLASTAWLVFAFALRWRFPSFEPEIPWPAMLQSWAIVGAGAVSCVLIVCIGRPSVRNVALSGSILSSAVSCMVFASMSGLAAPSALAYDLSLVVAAMAVCSTLAATGLWLLHRSQRLRHLSGLLLGTAFPLLTILSLMSVLPFSEWQMAAATPGAMAFRPVIVVFLSELGVSVALGLLGTGVDRQIATQFARENERLRQLSESTFEALVIHRDGTVLDANSAFCSLIGRSLSEIQGEPVARFVPAAKELSLVSPVTGRPEPLEIEIAGADNTPLPVELLSREIPYARGAARVTALRDIRERRAAEQRIWYLAQHDLLTGLPNRAHFNDVMTRQLALSKRDGIPLAVFCIDLDRFKHVNDTLGHAAGDLLLKQVADRITGIIREGDTLARIGGDEFVLLQTGAAQPEGSAQLAQRVIDRLTEPFDLNGSSATVGASIGVALAPQDADKADELVSYADIALYRAKANGRGAYCFFKTGMDTLLRQRRELEQGIAHAISVGGFTLDFQPLFSGESTDRLIGFEALLRWPDPVRGMIPPADFIPLAEECGLIVPLGAWVLQAACHEAVSWPEPWRVAVNVSPRQFSTGDLVATVREVLDRTGLDPARLEIEITETLLITDSDAALRTLQNLKRLGVRIVLDDFGTGYSSLSYLQRFPFDKVKIDRSFVTGLVTNDNARAIVNAILAMSHQLHLEVTAEGVEQEAQLSILRSSHCDQIQGFLLARPIPQHELPRFIEYRGNAGQDHVDEAALSH